MGIFKHQLLELVAFNIYNNCSLSSHLKTSFVLIFGFSVKALINRHNYSHLKENFSICNSKSLGIQLIVYLEYISMRIVPIECPKSKCDQSHLRKRHCSTRKDLCTHTLNDT